ncbi:MAG: hypothetical protein EAZ30_04425 [Betaproteobacteria bacterium]|nr:MAG: hypothetical protein EAZ30_04425 [Betaproteobacteria bacterium]
MAVDASGNTYTTGRIFNGRVHDWLTVKTDPNGQELWRSIVAGDATTERLTASLAVSFAANDARMVKLDQHGNVYVVGTTTLREPTLSRRCTLLKYSKDGTEIWRVNPPLPSAPFQYSESACFRLTLDANGDVILSGSVGLTAAPRIEDAYVSKVSAAGVPQWSDVVSTAYDQRLSVGGPVTTDDFGNVYVVNSLQIERLDYDWAARKLNGLTGAQIWRRDGGSVGLRDSPTSLIVSPSNDKLAISWAEEWPSSPITGFAVWSFLDSSNGNLLHARKMGHSNSDGSPSGSALPGGVAFDVDGSSVIAATVSRAAPASGDIRIEKLAGNYSTVWQLIEAVDSKNESVMALALHRPTQMIIVAGAMGVEFGGASVTNAYALHVNAINGVVNSRHERPGSGGVRDRYLAVGFDAAGNSYVAGNVSDAARMNFAQMKLDNSGGLAWSQFLGTVSGPAQLGAQFSSDQTHAAKEAFKLDALGNSYVALRVYRGFRDGRATHEMQVQKHDALGQRLWS